MKKVILIFSLIIFAACQKGITDAVDNSGGNNGGDSSSVNALKGSWNFTSISANTQNTSELNFLGEDDKTISFTNYTSENNSGTLVVDDSMFRMNGYTYSIATILKTYSYQNGVLIDSLDVPFNYYVPASNSTAKYKLIGTDSVYFPEGGFLSTDSSTFKPYGLKFSISGTVLTFTQQLKLDTVVVNSGVSQHETSTGTGTLLFLAK
jgi:hypothetical protein